MLRDLLIAGEWRRSHHPLTHNGLLPLLLLPRLPLPLPLLRAHGRALRRCERRATAAAAAARRGVRGQRRRLLPLSLRCEPLLEVALRARSRGAGWVKGRGLGRRVAGWGVGEGWGCGQG